MKYTRVITGILILALALVPSALAGGYKDYNPTLELLNQSNNYGYVNFAVVGVPYSNPYVYITKGDFDVTTLNTTRDADYKLGIYPDGSIPSIKLGGGNWTAYVISGMNIPYTEIINLKIGNRAIEWIAFEGETHVTGSGGCGS